MAPLSDDLQTLVRDSHDSWLITGVGGFIGSHILETLLELGRSVRGVDNFSTGQRENLDAVRQRVGEEAWAKFEMVEGDIRDEAACAALVEGVTAVLHQAALGSVPRSIEDPANTHANNVTGTLNLLDAARQAGVKRFVYASSSSVYGDHPGLPKVEDSIGKPLSPYAAGKLCTEEYAHSFASSYGLDCVGLRYFNVFGPRQNPAGAYAAVIPKWIDALKNEEEVVLNGDPGISRDFTHVSNVVEANLRAACAPIEPGSHVFNIACGGRITLAELFDGIVAALDRVGPSVPEGKREPVIGPPRPGDIAHSHADIGHASRGLGYVPRIDFREGLVDTVRWYLGAGEQGSSA